jgi:hypothetical protein
MTCPKIAEVKEKLPCELCDLIVELRKIVSQTGADIKQLAPVIAYEAMKKDMAKIEKMHKKCAGCGLCFGGEHIAMKRYVANIGYVCQWCEKEIETRGINDFIKRKKIQDREAKHGG